MTLFLSLLPLFLFGNLHCAGMCGPLVMLLAKHPYRWFYFLGRVCVFSMMGLISAEIGLFFFSFLAEYHISALFSLSFGLLILILGFSLLFQFRFPGTRWITKLSSKLSILISRLIAFRSPYATFVYGLCTILLPCGQTVIVFSLIALSQNPLAGLLNGFLFALCTSPALIASLYTAHFFSKHRSRYHMFMGITTVLVGGLAILRGCADCAWINHMVLNPSSPPSMHIVLY